MTIRTLAHRRASWRAHFLAIAREAQANAPQCSWRGRGGRGARVRGFAPAIRSRAMPAAAAP